MLQVQHQMACAGVSMGQLIAFTGGDLKRMLIPRNERLVQAIETAVAEFWADVAAAREPPVDFNVDAEAVSRLAYLTKLRTLTMTPDNAPIFAEWAKQRDAVTVAETARDAAKAKILKAVVDAGEGNDESVRVVCGDWKVSVSKIQENPGKPVTPEMVGTVIGAKKGYLRCALSNTAEKKK